ncbi:MAG: 30S ribosomal protein S6 [Thermoanaerobacterales bacterium]|jgi:small subunit ribosomal protein S6|nr:30S ribosomal protein S6 [Thermoanaerobacterales bacterium]
MIKYETLYIIDPEQEDDAIKELIEKVKGVVEENDGQVTQIEEWGKKRLAYPINDRREGYYVLMNFEADTKAVRALDRIFKITGGIIRHIIVKK